MIDLHCHVLPGLDDGPQTLADSLALCQAAAQAGTTTVVATPHVSSEWPLNTPAVIAASVSWLSDTLAGEGVELQVLPGAEVALATAARLRDDQLWGHHLAGGPWLLVECPRSPSVAGFDRILYSLQERDHRIVLAHPERCPAFHRDPGALEAFVRTGMLSSITAGSLTGRFGRTVQRFAWRLIKDGLVHNIASDGHNLSRRPPLSTADLRAAGLGAAAEFYVDSVPRAILQGDELPHAWAQAPSPLQY
jgi:protein-tyrosine phosphatase